MSGGPPFPAYRRSCALAGRLCRPSLPAGGATGAPGGPRPTLEQRLKKPPASPRPSLPRGRSRTGCPRWGGMAPLWDATLFSAGLPRGTGSNGRPAPHRCGRGSAAPGPPVPRCRISTGSAGKCSPALTRFAACATLRASGMMTPLRWTTFSGGVGATSGGPCPPAPHGRHSALALLFPGTSRSPSRPTLAGVGGTGRHGTGSLG